MLHDHEAAEMFFQHGLHVPTRTLYIGDEDKEIDAKTAANVIKSMRLLESISKTKPIKVLLNTVGGCKHSGLAIYDALLASPCYVTVEVFGAALSMGSVILQAGDWRVMRPSATLMMHDGSFSTEENTRNFENWAAWSKEWRQVMYGIFAEKTGRKPAYWASRCSSDWILSATMAREEKLIDEIAAPTP